MYLPRVTSNCLRAADRYAYILVVEALRGAVFLSEGRVDTYRHRKYDRRIVLFHHSTEVYGPANRNRNAAYSLLRAADRYVYA
jgi:hypothetical protein